MQLRWQARRKWPGKMRHSVMDPLPARRARRMRRVLQTQMMSPSPPSHLPPRVRRRWSTASGVPMRVRRRVSTARQARRVSVQLRPNPAVRARQRCPMPRQAQPHSRGSTAARHRGLARWRVCARSRPWLRVRAARRHPPWQTRQHSAGAQLRHASPGQAQPTRLASRLRGRSPRRHRPHAGLPPLQAEPSPACAHPRARREALRAEASAGTSPPVPARAASATAERSVRAARMTRVPRRQASPRAQASAWATVCQASRCPRPGPAARPVARHRRSSARRPMQTAMVASCATECSPARVPDLPRVGGARTLRRRFGFALVRLRPHLRP